MENNELNTNTNEQTNPSVEPVMPTEPVVTSEPTVQPAQQPVQAAPVQPVQEQVQATPVQPTQEPKKGKSNNMILIVLLIIILLAGAGASYYFLIYKQTKDKGGVTTTTTTTTAAVGAEITGTKYKLDFDGGCWNYFVLSNNTLYAPVDALREPTIENYVMYEGAKMFKLDDNVKSVYTVNYGNGGYVKTFYTDMDGKLHLVVNSEYDDENMKNVENACGSVKTIENVSKVKDVYSLASEGAYEYIVVDESNNIVYPTEKYVYYDLKNNVGKNKLADGTIIELSRIKDSKNEFNLKINDKEVNRTVKYEDSEETDYNSLQLMIFNYCKKGNDYNFGEECE